MYLSLNFRFPTGAMDRNQAAHRDSGGIPTQESAFKHPLPSLTDTKNPEPLPPISSLRTEGGQHHNHHQLSPPQFPPTKPALHPNPQTSHHHHHHHLINSLTGSQGHHHPTPPTTLSPPTLQSPSYPTPSFCAPANHGVAHHPAFAFPMGLPSWLPSATHPMNPSQLQQMMASDGGLMAQYLNGCDPLARAALMELTRMGHYPLGKKLFGCPQCRYVTDRKNNLKRHVATMHQDCDKVLECCGILFKNKASLRDHVLIFHSNGYMCRFCGRNFCRKALLKRHLTVHSGQKDFICDQCDYATSHKSNLERHRKVHERQGDDGSDESSCGLSENDSQCRLQGIVSEGSNNKGLTLYRDNPHLLSREHLQQNNNKNLSLPGSHTILSHHHQHLHSHNMNSRPAGTTDSRLALRDRVYPATSHSEFSSPTTQEPNVSSSTGKSSRKDGGLAPHRAAASKDLDVDDEDIDIGMCEEDGQNCLIDLDDEFDLNNIPINVVDIDV